VNCPACQHENRPGAKFCEECAAPLPRACASCGAELRPTAKFCDECGTPVAAGGARPAAPPPATAAELAGARKTVTIVFADLVGSTALHERLDPESARRFMESYYAAMRGVVEAHGGTVTQLLGDGVKAVFGIPRVAEDDAIRAVRAAVSMQDAFRALAEAQRSAVGSTGLRVAVNTGEVVAEGTSEIIGDPVNVAARLQEQGQDGDVVAGESTHRLVSTQVKLELLGSFALKGRTETVRAYRVVSLDRPAGAATAPFVGRDEELARLEAVYETAMRKPAASLAVLVGSPGLGKSRLLDEFARRHAEGATVVDAHCDATGGATFAPLAEALREWLGIEAAGRQESLRESIEGAVLADEPDRARIASGIAAVLTGSPTSPEETFFEVRRFLAALARQQPVILVIDDLQWGEPLLLDLVEHLIQWGSGVPLLVLVAARPELRELRSSLAVPGGLVSDVVTLAGLDAGAAMRLAANAIGAADLPAAVAAKVLATSEGNPLFVGELVRMLVEEGALTKEGGRWTVGANLPVLEMPPTIHALLAARLERLRPEERILLERAAVVGRHFSRSTVAALLPGEAGDLDARLEALRRSELIERDTGWLLGEPVLRFHHALIRDAAYRRLLKGTRAELHARLADWMEGRVGVAADHDETIGWHLEQAHQLLGELGPLDERGRALGARAAARLAAAGRRALARDDLPVAAELLGRAIERLDASDPARADLALDWSEALLAAGDVAAASAAIDELGRFAARSDRLRAWHGCFAGELRVLTEPQDLQSTVESVAAAAEALAAQGDASGEAKAHFVHAQAFARLGRVGACEAALDRSLAAARRAGDRRRANAVLAGAPLAALWGPSPVTRASGRCLDVVRVLRITEGSPAVESVALSCQSVLEALRGRTDAAKRMIASVRQMVEELGIAQRLHEADVFAGRIALLEGDVVGMERLLRGAYDGLRALGLGIDAARAGALLARALLAQDRVAEAEALSHESEALAGDDLQAAISWRAARAEALARRGEHAAAVELARAAVAIAAATDALLYHADARIALAAALRADGRGAEADAEELRARELWEAKGATLLVERARSEAAPPALLPAAAVPNPARRRRVGSNRATAHWQRMEAALAERDFACFRALFSDDHQEIDHPSGSAYGADASVASIERLFRSREPRYRTELVATLGEWLALGRRNTSAAGAASRRYDVGAYENETLQLMEAGEAGLAVRSEVFALDRLADAVARLYERHAERLPEGPERTRAGATALAVSRVLCVGFAAEPEAFAAAFSAELEWTDHRTLGGFGSGRGVQSLPPDIAAAGEVGDEIVSRGEDVLALNDRALLLRWRNSGIVRDGGGAFEWPFLRLLLFGADGPVVRYELFDVEEEAAALARFDALTAESPRPHRRVCGNAATRTLARFDAACAAGDQEAVIALCAEHWSEIDHPTGASYGREEARTSLRSLLDHDEPYMSHEPLATLGERLALGRRKTGARATGGGRFDVGAWEREELALLEVDGDACILASEVFAADHLGDALARLYERWAEQLPEGPARARAAAIGRSIAAYNGAIDPDRIATVLDPASRNVDHRVFGTWSTGGAPDLLAHYRQQLALAPEFAARFEDVFALGPDALLTRMSFFGTARESGGAFENRILCLMTFGADGLLGDTETFEAEQVAQALARFEELTRTAAGTTVARRVKANAATLGCDRFAAELAARDTDAVARRFDESLRVVHHPTGSTYGRREMLATWRSAMKAERLEFCREVLATLGDALVLARQVTAVEGLGEAHLKGFGPTEVHELSLVETDAHGRFLHAELFAPDRLGDAIVRLYERWAEQLPEGPARRRAAAIARGLRVQHGPIDPDRITAGVAPGSRNVDHRVFGTWSTSDQPEMNRHFREQLELAPDFAARFEDVLALGPDRLLARMSYYGTARDGGGAFENPVLCLMTFGADGLLGDTETFEAEQVARALARFDAVRARTPEPPFANAASRSEQHLTACWAARDWEGVVAAISPAIRFDDRRRLLRTDVDYEGFLAQFRMLFEQPGSRWTEPLLATRGERLSLHRVLFEAEAPQGGGPLALDEHLGLIEVDAEGRQVGVVVFDLEDEDAAYAELDARFVAGEAAAHDRAWAALDRILRSVAERDWETLAASFAPDFRIEDHRRFGWDSALGRAEAFVQGQRILFDLAPDYGYRADHVRTSPRAGLVQLVESGTRDGGPFENRLLCLGRLDDDGRFRRFDLYDLDQLDAARARFEEVRDGGSGAPLVASNRATAAMEGWESLFEAALASGDWERVRARCAPDMRFEDRTHVARVAGDRDLYVESMRARAELGARPAITVIGAAGDRVAIVHSLWTGGPAEGRFEMELFAVIEVDEAALLCAMILLDDARAAQREAWARWAAIEPLAQAPTAWIAKAADAFNARDRAAIRVAFASDLVVEDHRRTGMGRMECADAYVASLAALWELAATVQVEFGRFWPAVGRHGALTTVRRAGMVAGGGAFESEDLYLFLVERGCVTHVEMFELEDLDRALERFDALRPDPQGARSGSRAPHSERKASEVDPLAIPPNAAVRSMERLDAYSMAGDWEAIRALCAPTVFEDRRRGLRTKGGCEAMVEGVRFLHDAGVRATRTLLATAGDRWELHHSLWHDDDQRPTSEAEMLELFEVDAEGRIVAVVLFDPEDRAAASAELFERYAAGGAEGAPAATIDFVRAVAAHDLPAARAALVDDFVFHDRRRTGSGLLTSADAYAGSLAAIFELSADVRLDTLYSVAIEPHGRVAIGRTWGTNTEGGEFESVYVSLIHYRDERVAGIELFELEDREAALARLEALRPERAGPGSA
jgi:class 3 adenylate cyclase